MLTANCSLCPCLIRKTALCWQPVLKVPNGVTQKKKKWRGEALLSVEFLCSGDSLWAWESLLLTQMKLHDFLLHAQIACHTRAPLPSARTEFNSAPTTRRLCFECVLCPLKAFVVSAFPYPEKQDASHGVRVSAFSAGLRFSTVFDRIGQRSALEARVVYYTQISCVVKFWLERHWSGSGLGSDGTLITVGWTQLYTCLGGKTDGWLTDWLTDRINKYINK